MVELHWEGSAINRAIPSTFWGFNKKLLVYKLLPDFNFWLLFNHTSDPWNEALNSEIKQVNIL